MDIIDTAIRSGRSVLNEYEAKALLAGYGIPVAREILVDSQGDLDGALKAIGFPCVMKVCSSEAAHKTELGLIRVGVRSEQEAMTAYAEISAAMGESSAVLIQEYVKGQRELMVGMNRDPQFGPCVLFGLGGIFAEILEDVSFRMAPITMHDALDMMQDIRGHRILEAVRGMEAVNRETLGRILMQVGTIGMENPQVKEIDVNPLIIRGAEPVAVDALVVLA
jgi:acetate---CoA ligase (ADP-forming) subunit beta